MGNKNIPTNIKRKKNSDREWFHDTIKISDEEANKLLRKSGRIDIGLRILYQNYTSGEFKLPDGSYLYYMNLNQ